MSKDLLVAYDFGTSSVKAALFDIEGNILSNAHIYYPLIFPRCGWVEQRPDDLWHAMCNVTAKLFALINIDKSRIAALSICAQMCGTIPVDSAGNPLNNCLTWLDTRSRAIAHRITGDFIRIGEYGVRPLIHWLYKTNGIPNLSGRDPTTKIIWFRENAPSIWEQTHKFLDVKDYLIHRCCSRYITTPDVAHLTWLMESKNNKKCWSNDLLTHLKIDKEMLPEICHSTDIIGNLSSEAAGELGLNPGVAIVAGSGDVTASALGAGSINPMEIHLHIGSSAWLATHVPRRMVDIFSGIGTLCSANPDLYLLIAAQQSAGICVDWTARLFGFLNNNEEPDYTAFENSARNSTPGARNLCFLPWLFGECVPKIDSHIRGGFINLSTKHTLQDMSRAVLEGVALNVRWAYNSMNRLIKHTEKPIRFVGGGANNGFWCQILADVLNHPIMQMETPHLAGTRGAAMIASVALKWYASLENAAKFSSTGHIYNPNQDLVEFYNERFKMFTDYYKRNKNWYAEFNKNKNE